MFGIRNAEDSEYTGLFYKQYMVYRIRTKPSVRIKANIGIHKIRNLLDRFYCAQKFSILHSVIVIPETKFLKCP